MKRTASTLVLLAGFGGGCAAPVVKQPSPQAQAQGQRAGGFGTVTRGKEVGGLQGAAGEPVMAMRGTAPGGVRQAGATTLVGSNGMIRPVGGIDPMHVTSGEGCAVPGVGGAMVRDAGMGYGAFGPNGPQMPRGGIVPVPTMGPPGAVAAFGAIGAGGGMGRMGAGMPNGRAAINFTGPAGMKVTWQLPDGTFNDEATALTAPKEYNFLQGSVYRLRLTSILPDHPGKSFYPTLEIAPANPKSLVFLSHSSVPLTFSADDFAQARAGNLVVKVVYLPDSANQTFNPILGAEEVVSTRLEPGADPVAEAQRMGTVLAIIRMGNIDLENRVSPAMTAPPPGVFVPPGGFVPPGAGPLLPPVGPIPGPGPKPKGGSDLPPGTATVRPPAALPALPPDAPTDLPPAPVGPSVGPGPVSPGPKPPVK